MSGLAMAAKRTETGQGSRIASGGYMSFRLGDMSAFSAAQRDYDNQVPDDDDRPENWRELQRIKEQERAEHLWDLAHER
jgi:hypothetical protein